MKKTGKTNWVGNLRVGHAMAWKHRAGKKTGAALFGQDARSETKQQ